MFNYYTYMKKANGKEINPRELDKDKNADYDKDIDTVKDTKQQLSSDIKHKKKTNELVENHEKKIRNFVLKMCSNPVYIEKHNNPYNKHSFHHHFHTSKSRSSSINYDMDRPNSRICNRDQHRELRRTSDDIIQAYSGVPGNPGYKTQTLGLSISPKHFRSHSNFNTPTGLTTTTVNFKTNKNSDPTPSPRSPKNLISFIKNINPRAKLTDFDLLYSHLNRFFLEEMSFKLLKQSAIPLARKLQTNKDLSQNPLTNLNPVLKHQIMTLINKINSFLVNEKNLNNSDLALKGSLCYIASALSPNRDSIDISNLDKSKQSSSLSKLILNNENTPPRKLRFIRKNKHNIDRFKDPNLYCNETNYYALNYNESISEDSQSPAKILEDKEEETYKSNKTHFNSTISYLNKLKALNEKEMEEKRVIQERLNQNEKRIKEETKLRNAKLVDLANAFDKGDYSTKKVEIVSKCISGDPEQMFFNVKRIVDSLDEETKHLFKMSNPVLTVSDKPKHKLDFSHLEKLKQMMKETGPRRLQVNSVDLVKYKYANENEFTVKIDGKAYDKSDYLNIIPAVLGKCLSGKPGKENFENDGLKKVKSSNIKDKFSGGVINKHNVSKLK